MSFIGKTAVITGATRGIGLSIAKSFADQGAHTILIGHDVDRVNSIQTEFRNKYTHQSHQGMALDISNKEQVNTLLKDLLKAHNRIDYLINAAGISRDGLLVQLKEDDLLETINTNLLGTIRVTKQVVKSMLKNKKSGNGGCIINISSSVGLHGNVGQTVYSASKAGLIGFTKSLAKELGPSQIRVNAIAPGFIETDMTRHIPDIKKQKIMEMISLGRFGSVEDISLAAIFIAQSKYMHGQVLTIDGGLNI
ncbi:carbonyl reductase family member 4 [Cokeromyces recurvatus]|uniref:carbonyl reductase family member 4 n=1 Tax=Cokeromyces recurvatus TaxID=90255 RepID=UPI0022210422|nr:carbonyl reductase family member 4 [Cokeromyces recurvatus]KAI7905057.1 carbonyl reductase family member 4 [Cokeromyces recurvatus]